MTATFRHPAIPALPHGVAVARQPLELKAQVRTLVG